MKILLTSSSTSQDTCFWPVRTQLTSWRRTTEPRGQDLQPSATLGGLRAALTWRSACQLAELHSLVLSVLMNHPPSFCCRNAGAQVSLLSPTQTKETFPWINIAGVALASHGEFTYIQPAQKLAAELPQPLSQLDGYSSWAELHHP